MTTKGLTDYEFVVLKHFYSDYFDGFIGDKFVPIAKGLVTKGYLKKRRKADHFQITESGKKIFLRDKSLGRF